MSTILRTDTANARPARLRSRRGWGMGGTPMASRKAGLPGVRGTRTPCPVERLPARPGAAPRKGRGLQLPGFAGVVYACKSASSRPEKRLFAVARALFFIARNEGSSMVPDNYSCIHRIKYTHRRGKIDKDRETRAMLSDRFKSMYRQMGLDRPAAAKLLHVSERTLHNWETGVHEIPYSAYKLLRLLGHTELPGAWSGWHISVGRLWSPEGHGFKPADSSWWSLLCRRAAGFDALYQENARLKAAIQATAPATTGADGKRSAAASGGAGAQVEVPVTLHLSAKSDTFRAKKLTAPVIPACPARVRYNLPKALFTTTVKGGQA